MAVRSLFWLGVVGLALWCMFTDEGKAFFVAAAAKVGMAPAVIELDFEQLRGGMAKSEVLALHPQLDYFCYEDSKVPLFGESGCNENISLLNGMRAYNVALFFKRDELNVMRIALQPESYDSAMAWMSSKYKNLGLQPGGSFTGGKKYPITVWQTQAGNYVLSSRDETQVGEVILLWMKSLPSREF